MGNWGLNSDTGMNLYTTGKKTDEKQHPVFQAFTAALAYAIHKYGSAYRAGVASSGNDHRLGAQEAPPAIMSLYTGWELEKHIDAIIKAGPLEGYKAIRYGKGDLETGSSATEKVGRGAEDRNRTAPIPFCGNRFEFRAVGSDMNISIPMTIMNTAVAEGCSVISTLIEGGKSVRDAVAEVYKNARPAIFNGNGYSKEWHAEAKERGLKILPTTVEAWQAFLEKDNVELFAKHSVFTEKESHAMAEIQLERYHADLVIEADSMISMINTGVIPACAADLRGYANTGLEGNRKKVYKALADAVADLVKVRAEKLPDDVAKQAQWAKDSLKVAMNKVREAHDAAESLIESKLYPFPTYEELLFPHQYEKSDF